MFDLYLKISKPMKRESERVRREYSKISCESDTNAATQEIPRDRGYRLEHRLRITHFGSDSQNSGILICGESRRFSLRQTALLHKRICFWFPLFSIQIVLAPMIASRKRTLQFMTSLRSMAFSRSVHFVENDVSSFQVKPKSIRLKI